MPRAIPAAVRQAIWNRFQQGQSAVEIAQQVQLRVRTVRHLLWQFRLQGQQAFQSAYQACGQQQVKEYRELRREVLQLRRQHPGWGGGRLLVQLRRRHPDRRLACERTLQRWLHDEQTPPAPAGRPRLPRIERASGPHQVWEMDAAEQKRLATAKMISWLRVVDECSGAALRTSVFSRGTLHTCSTSAGAEAFAGCFHRGGMPEMMRVDNGAPWGSWSDLPTELALWLIGLGIRVWWNEPRQPQQNPVVERSHGVAIAWADPGQCRTARQFQLRINREDRLQREEYPSIGGLPRMTAYPDLKHSGRPYSIRWERRHWNWERVCAELAGYAVSRHVDCSGKIGVYHRKLYVGTRHKTRDIYVQFDPERREWVVSDERFKAQQSATLAPAWPPP